MSWQAKSWGYKCNIGNQETNLETIGNQLTPKEVGARPIGQAQNGASQGKVTHTYIRTYTQTETDRERERERELRETKKLRKPRN